MHIEQFIKRLEKTQQTQKGFEYKLGKLLELVDFMTFEKKVGFEIPSKIKGFYAVANGLITTNPDFKIIEFNSWVIEDDLIHFATFDNTIKVYFVITELNNANEWTIINKSNNYVMTLSISSFWSNKIWHWLEQKHKIWADNWWIS